MKKEQYENLEFEVIRFRSEDVITTSQTVDREPEPDPTGRQQTPYVTQDDTGTSNEPATIN